MLIAAGSIAAILVSALSICIGWFVANDGMTVAGLACGVVGVIIGVALFTLSVVLTRSTRKHWREVVGDVLADINGDVSVDGRRLGSARVRLCERGVIIDDPMWPVPIRYGEIRNIATTRRTLSMQVRGQLVSVRSSSFLDDIEHIIAKAAPNSVVRVL